MNNWQELHNDNGDDNADKVYNQMVEIEFGNYVVYECTGDVELYNGIPCDAEVTKMVRRMFNFDGDGSLMDEMELALEDFPHYIQKAAEKKLVEGL